MQAALWFGVICLAGRADSGSGPNAIQCRLGAVKPAAAVGPD